MLELLKVIVQPVILERNEDGKIIGEQAANAQPLYSEDEVREFFALIESEVAKHNAAASAPAV
jgi:hypothetical protein